MLRNDVLQYTHVCEPRAPHQGHILARNLPPLTEIHLSNCLPLAAYKVSAVLKFQQSLKASAIAPFPSTSLRAVSTLLVPLLPQM